MDFDESFDAFAPALTVDLIARDFQSLSSFLPKSKSGGKETGINYRLLTRQLESFCMIIFFSAAVKIAYSKCKEIEQTKDTTQLF